MWPLYALFVVLIALFLIAIFWGDFPPPAGGAGAEVDEETATLLAVSAACVTSSF